jgi:hypothetical protein
MTCAFLLLAHHVSPAASALVNTTTLFDYSALPGVIYTCRSHDIPYSYCVPVLCSVNRAPRAFVGSNTQSCDAQNCMCGPQAQRGIAWQWVNSVTR